MGQDGTSRSLLLVLFVGFAAVSAVTSAMTSIFVGGGASKAESVNTGEADVAMLHSDIEQLHDAVDQLTREIRVLAAPRPERVVSEAAVADGGGGRPGRREPPAPGENSEEAPARDPGARGFGGRGGFDAEQFRGLRSENEAERLAAARGILAGEGGMGMLMAIDVLLELSPAEGLAALRDYAANPPENGRGRGFGGGSLGDALANLVKMEDLNLGSELTFLFNTGNDDMQLASAKLLAEQGDSSLMNQLLRKSSLDLYATDVKDRLSAIREIGGTRSALGNDYLLPLLHDSSIEVRLAALDALRRSGDEKTIAQLETLLNDPVERVRERAEEAIQSIRNPGRGGTTGRGGRGGGGDTGAGRRGGRGG